MRIVTYNIHKGIGGVDRRYRPERVVEVIAHCEPDIVCLQEVDEGVPRSREHRQIDLLGDRLDLPHRIYQPNVRLKKGHYGNAILSRYPLTHPTLVNLTIPMKKPRGAIVCHCHVPRGAGRGTLLLCTTHLGLAGFERAMQLRRLLQLEPFTRWGSKRATLIAGDFNDGRNALRRLLDPAGFQMVAPQTKTFPAVLPLRPLDRILGRGAIHLHGGFASRTDIARAASDHLPLVADFELKALG